MSVIEPNPRRPRATSIDEAAFGPALEYREPDPGSYYVDRPRLEVNGRTPPPFSDRVRNRLVGGSPGKSLLVTGQTGSGKSTELRRVLRDPKIHTKFERVQVRFREQVNLTDAEIRATLLSVATSVAEHLAEAHPEKLPGGRFSPIRRWFHGLRQDYEDVGITPSLVTEATLRFDTPLAQLTTKIRDEARLRTRVLEDARFDKSELLAVANNLIDALSEAAERPVLLVIDDGDKLTEEGPAHDIFIENFPMLTSRLHGDKVITFPYWLYLSGSFEESRRQADKDLCLNNVKVYAGPQAPQLLSQAESFFRDVAHTRLEPHLIEDEAVRIAARHSAGIPREFLRILCLAAADGVDYGQEALDVSLLEATVVQLRREMSRATQRDETLEALKRIRREKRLRDKDDRLLLRQLLVVELPNDNPWYDVHPILQGYVDDLA